MAKKGYAILSLSRSIFTILPSETFMKAGLMICVSLIALGLLANPGRAEESTSAFFEKTVWAKVGERTCLKCHKAGGKPRNPNLF